MEEVELKGFAKINLGLDVVGVLPNGYHLVEMVMESINLYDTIKIKKTNFLFIRLESNQEDLPLNEENIAYRAAKLLIEEFQLKEGVEIHLEKRIPVAAGLAGGSTNAAAVLKGMNQLFDLGLKEKELMERGLTLGADVPFCIQEKTALATGIGEELTPLPSLPSCYILLGKIPVEVSTKEIYQELDSLEVIEHPKTDRIIKALEQGSLKELGQYLGNVLELVTIPKFPLIQEIKDEMIKAGALGALMSGSGPTVFGLFEDKTLAEKAKEKIEKQGIANQVILVSTKDERREKNET